MGMVLWALHSHKQSLLQMVRRLSCCLLCKVVTYACLATASARLIVPGFFEVVWDWVVQDQSMVEYKVPCSSESAMDEPGRSCVPRTSLVSMGPSCTGMYRMQTTVGLSQFPCMLANSEGPDNQNQALPVELCRVKIDDAMNGKGMTSCC